MSCKYAGVELLASTPEIEKWIEENIEPKSIYEEAVHYWAGPNLQSFPSMWEVPEVIERTGSLFWPQGACRWAVGRFLVSDKELTQIKAQVFAGGGYKPQLFTMTDEKTGTGIATKLFMLPARPLAQRLSSNDQLYVITLVDERFFWWFKSEGTISVNEGTTTWANLYTSIGTALGVTINADAVPSAYLKPTNFFAESYEDLPTLLDQTAYNVGQRIVRELDGTVRALSWSSSDLRIRTNLAKNYDVMAGGKFAFSPGPGTELNALVPKSVDVVFNRSDDGALNTTQYVKNITLTSLSLPEFTGTTGYDGKKTLKISTIASFTSGSPDNATEINNLATQAVIDWYRNALSRVDIKFIGIVPWILDGLHGLVEWVHDDDECSTRIIRSNWPAGDSLNFQGTFGSGPTVIINDPTIINETYIYNLFFQFFSMYNPLIVTYNTDQNNIDVRLYSFILVTATTSYIKLTSFIPNNNFQFLVIINVGTKPFLIPHNNGGGGAGNRIFFLQGCPVDRVLNPGRTLLLLYNPNAGGPGVPGWNPIDGYFNPQNPYTPSSFSTNQNNYDRLDAGYLRLNPTSAANMTGMTSGYEGQMVYMQNVGSANLTIPNQDTNSSAANRFITPNGNPIVLAPQQTAIALYDCTQNRWIIIVGAGGLDAANGVAGSGPKDHYYWRFCDTGLSEWMRWHQPNTLGIQGYAGLGAASTANTLYCYPFPVPRDGTIVSALRYKVVTAAAAGKKAKVAIYSNISDTKLYPKDLVTVDEAAIESAVDSTGVKTCTFTTPVTLSAGLYWFAIISSGAPSYLMADGSVYAPLGSLNNTAFSGLASNWVIAHGSYGLPTTADSGGSVSSDLFAWQARLDS